MVNVQKKIKHTQIIYRKMKERGERSEEEEEIDGKGEGGREIF